MSDPITFEEEEFETQFNGQTLLRIIKLARPHWPYLVGFLLLISLVSAAESYQTYLSKLIVDEGVLAGDPDRLLAIIYEFLAISALVSLAAFGFIYLTGMLGEFVRYDLRRDMFDHLQDLSFSYFDRTPVGWIMSRVTSDTERVAELVTWGLLDITWAITSIGSAVIFMLFINWRLGLLISLVVPALVIVAAEFKRRILTEYRLVRRINSKITGAYNENIAGVRVTKAMAREEAGLAEFQHLSQDMFNASFRAAWLSALFLPAVQLITALAVGTVVWYGGAQAQIGNLSIGDIQAFVAYITFMLWPVQQLAHVYARMQQSIASAERVFSLIDAVPEITDQPEAEAQAPPPGDIVFENVCFYYEQDTPVLSDFNLHVRRGETIALVGPTGGGKSTIVNLVCRFYEPRDGRILIGGHDYTSFTQSSLQSQIGMVLQTPHLFSGTIRENIRYGRLDATDAEVEAAASMASADRFIMAMPKGYDEEVGEGGGLLSVGQKQLISLARAILAQPEIFIMDEATSSVDTLTEALIQEGVDRLMVDRTSFIIAHRLSTIRRADRILVIRDGRITESGDHTELIRQRGHYYRLYTRQFRRERAARLPI